MKPLRVISLNLWLPILVSLTIVILVTIMVFNQRNQLIENEIQSSIAFINNDLNVLTLEMKNELKNGHEFESKRAFLIRGLINEYKIFVLLDDEGRNTLSIQNDHVGQLAKTTFPNFDSSLYKRVLKKRQSEIHLNDEENIITAYFPLTLEPESDEIRPSKIGVLFLVYDLSYSMDKVKGEVWQLSQLSLIIGLASIILVLIFLEVYVSKPLQHLISITKQLAKGKLGLENQLTGKGELIALADSFNLMSQQLRKEHASLKESEARFRKLYDDNPAMLFTVDEIGTVLSVNRYGIDQLGYTIEQLIDQPVTNVFHEEDKFLVQKNLKQCFAEPDKVHHWELRKIRHDGTVIWVHETARIVIDIDGKSMVMITCEDITERQRLKDRFQQVFNNSPNALIITNEQGEITLTNSNTTTMFGYEDAQLIDMSIEDLMPERYRGHHPKLRQGYMSEPSPRPMSAGRNLYGLRKDGLEFPIEISLNLIESESESCVLSTITDITKRQQIANKLKESEERYAFAMKGANDGLWDWDLLTDEVHYSPRWKSMLGYAENEISNDLSEWKRLIHPDDLDSAVSNAQAFINNDVDKYELDFRMQHKDGHYIDILSRAFAVEDEAGKVTRLVGTHVDITQRKQAEEQLNYQSTHDALTGLVNRREFENRMQRLLATAKEHSQHHALCYMDLDQFKVVNDTCGHTAGDEMLRQLSTMLRQVVRHRDTLARLGGDEFGVLMEHCSLDDAHRVATSIQTAIQDYQFLWEERSFRVSVSMGLVPITDTTFNLTDLLKDADAACYMAKDKGRNRIHVHRDEDKELANRHGEMQWVSRIQEALDDNRFCLYAQSIESLDNATDVHYELLIRMLDEQGEIIPPGAFLPAAERYNLITQLDQWVIENAFKALTENLDFQRQINFISINLSGLSLANETFLDFVVQQFHEHEIKGEKICFEITETAAISNLSKADKFISRLRRLGCRFALDDFGSGLSSFGYLKNLPVNFLKIDGMFVKDMVTDQIDHAMVKSINEIGQVMGMQTIAEFVENDEIKGMLREIGVNYAQGYGIHKPQPFDELLNRANNVTNINKSKDDETKS